MSSWKVVDHTDDQVLVEFENGARFYYNLENLINQKKYQAPEHGLNPTTVNPGVSLDGVSYTFETGAVLTEHKHDDKTIHNIECIAGHIVVHRAIQGDVEALAGDVVDIQVDELHSVTAIEPSKTIHWLYK